MLARMKAAGMIPNKDDTTSPGARQPPVTPAAQTTSSMPLSTGSSGGGVRRFASPTKRNYMDDDTAGIFVGVGLLFEQSRAYGKLPTVTAVEPNGGAANGRVAVGDQIETINGADVRYMESEPIARRLMGPENSDVTLGLLRRDADGRTERITAEVRRLIIPHVKKGMSIPNSSFGALDPGINLASVLSNMRSSSSLPDDEQQTLRRRSTPASSQAAPVSPPPLNVLEQSSMIDTSAG